MASTVLAALALGGGVLAAQTQPNSDAVFVLVPGTSPAQAINSAVAAPIVWMDRHGCLLAVSIYRPDTVRQLYRADALFVAVLHI